MKSLNRLAAIKLISTAVIFAVAAGGFTSCARPGMTDSGRNSSGEEEKPSYIEEPSDSPSGASDGQGEPAGETVTETTGSAISQVGNGDWYSRVREEDGIRYTAISNSGSHGRTEQIEYLYFRVYDTEEDAVKELENMYRMGKKNDKGLYWEEDGNWWICEKPNVYDARIVGLYYREGNVIIFADLYSGAIGSVDSESFTLTDKNNLKEYVLQNSAEIRRFVLDELMV